ncbi:MAG: site-2 protease family protein, partial [Venatoribacter sp.]
DALTQGLEKTYDTIVFTLDSLWKMLKGMLSVKNLSGPVSIAKVAGASASGGLESFVSFLALLSISLGVLNLLPVPVLDGGHIVFCLAEIIRGKPLPEYVQQWAIKVGMFLLLGIMLVAFYNDLGRL